MQLLQLSGETTGEKTLPRQSRSEAGTRRKRKSGTSSIPLSLKCSPFLKNLLLLIKPEQDLKLLCQISGMMERTGFFFFFFLSHMTWTQRQVCACCVTVGKSFTLSEPRLPHLENGNDRADFTGLWGRSNEKTWKHPVKCLALCKCELLLFTAERDNIECNARAP